MDKTFIDETILELHTIQDMLRWVISRFNATNIHYGHGTDNCLDEALQLVLPSLFLPLDIPQQFLGCRLTLSERHCIIKRVSHRINKRIPVAYLTNKAWFCGYEFYVDKNVLIPRSPIAELINQHFAGIINYEPATILDMCTGSGCIAVACGYEFLHAKIHAVDISADALAVAKRNINTHGFTNRIIPIRSDLFLNMPLIKYDLIITNPPYVDAEDMANLPAEHLAEPKLALAAGSDGLKLVRKILANASRFLTKNGVLVCEVGNSMLHLITQYPDIPFTCLQLEHGGDGVFMLTQKQLIQYQEKF